MKKKSNQDRSGEASCADFVDLLYMIVCTAYELVDFRYSVQSIQFLCKAMKPPWSPAANPSSTTSPVRLVLVPTVVHGYATVALSGSASYSSTAASCEYVFLWDLGIGCRVRFFYHFGHHHVSNID